MSAQQPPPGFPKMPPGFDAQTGVPLLGTMGFSIFDRTLTIQEGDPPPSLFDRGFYSGPHGPPSLPLAVAATWCYAAAALGVHQQQIAEMYNVIQVQQAQLAHVVQTIQGLINALDEETATQQSEITQMREDMAALLDGVIVVQAQPEAAAKTDDAEGESE